MGAMTAQILIGSGHPNHDGIGPSHYLFLSENSRPAWLLVEQNLFQCARNRKIVWIPTVEDMLEDALLMIAVHVVKDQEVVDLIKSLNNSATSDRLEMYDSFDEAQRKMLYEKCRAVALPKLVLSVFRGSSILTQLSAIDNYMMDIEVCVAVYSRLSSQWSPDRNIQGSLNVLQYR
ncbi:hypothetical protein [Desulfonatronum parangueonense]